MTDLVDDVRILYSRFEHPIAPFIGKCFARDAERTLRIAAVGINSYVDAKDWPPNPEWFSGWFKDGNWHFFPRVYSEISKLARAVNGSALLGGLEYRGKDSVYLTNAVKEFLPAALGKRADQVDERTFAKYQSVWHDELNVFARHDVLPHLIVVFGEPQWRWVYEAFAYARPGEALDVVSYSPTTGDLRHRLNVVRVRNSSGAQPMILLRLTHPAAPTNRWRADELVLHADFRRVLAG